MELALAPALAAAGSSIQQRPNRVTQRAVPAFLNKLYSMVADESTDDLIRWSDDGDSFFVTSADRLGKELLPKFFKHSNFGSFVRQLNMYGFHKVPHLHTGVLKRDGTEEAELLEFSNPNFVRGQPSLLCMIKRQKAGKGETAAAAAIAAASLEGADSGSGSGGAGDGRVPSNAASLNIAVLLSDLAAIRKHQTAISADLKDLQARNHALWQEALQSREKHKKQEETINKILRFLAGVFGGQVLDAGQAGAQQQVGADDSASPEESSTSHAVGPASSLASAGGEGSSSGIGAGKDASGGSRSAAGSAGGGSGGGGGVVLMPKSRLLLEDVKDRQLQRRAALRELDGEEDQFEGRESSAGAARVFEAVDDDEIEEIPLLDAAERQQDMPVMSRALVASGPSATAGALTRAPSFGPGSPFSRFSAIPSPADSSSASQSAAAHGTTTTARDSSSSALIDPSQYNMPPEALKALLAAAGKNPNALQDFLRTSGSPAGGSTPVASTSQGSSSNGAGPTAGPSSTSVPSTSSALLPYHHAQSLYHPTPNPLDFAFSSSASSPSFATTLAPTTSALTAAALPSPVTFESALAENNDVLSSVLSEKADLDERTAALENQITKLLDNLPEDAREQVENEAADGESSHWAGIDWDNYSNGDGGVDFDKMLAQLSEISNNNDAPIDYSELLSNHALDPSLSSAPPSAATPSAMIDPSLYGFDPSASSSATAGIPVSQPAYEVTSPAETPTGTTPATEDLGSPASTVNSPASTASTPRATVAAAAARGRKRKSDALANGGEPKVESPGEEGSAAAAPGGTRRSTRRKR